MDSREALIRKLLAIRELKRRRRAAPLLYFKPHAGQRRVMEGMRSKRIVLVTSGNRFGKSTALAALVIAYCYGYYIWDVPGLEVTAEGDYPPRERVDPQYWTRRVDGMPTALPAKVAVITGLSALQGINRVLWPKIEELLPEGVRHSPRFKVHRGAFGVPAEVILPNGSIMRMGSGEQDPMQYEGQDNVVAVFDEPIPKPIFTAVWRGLTDHRGSVLFTMTPRGANATWMFEDFISPAVPRDDVLHISGSIHENPFIDEDAKREFLEGGGFSEEERACREHGVFEHVGHRCFPMFDPAHHVVPPEIHIPPGWVRGMAIDPAHRRPFMMVWAAFGPHGEMIVYREWPEQDHSKMRSSRLTVAEYARLIRTVENGERIDFRLLDPRFGAQKGSFKGQEHTSIQDDFAAAGMYFDCRLEGTEREETGIEKLREMLRFDRTAPLSPVNCPRLRVVSSCHNVLASLHLSTFVPPRSRDPDLLAERVHEKYKDGRDCLRYLALYPVGTVSVEGTEGYITEAQLREFNQLEWL